MRSLPSVPPLTTRRGPWKSTAIARSFSCAFTVCSGSFPRVPQLHRTVVRTRRELVFIPGVPRDAHHHLLRVVTRARGSAVEGWRRKTKRKTKRGKTVFASTLALRTTSREKIRDLFAPQPRGASGNGESLVTDVVHRANKSESESEHARSRGDENAEGTRRGKKRKRRRGKETVADVVHSPCASSTWWSRPWSAPRADPTRARTDPHPRTTRRALRPRAPRRTPPRAARRTIAPIFPRRRPST